MSFWDILNPVSGLSKLVLDVMDRIKLPPEKRAEIELQMAAYAQDIKKLEMEYRAKELEANAKETDIAGQNIRAEIVSNSWVGRNWRPLFCMVLGMAICANIIVPMVANITGRFVPLVEIPGELYMLFGFAFLGYGGLRSWEKVMEGRLNKAGK